MTESLTFPADLESILGDLTHDRADLVTTVQALADGDLDRARRGGWSVRRVLEHVIQSENLYAVLVTHLRELPVAQRGPVSCAGLPVPEILCQLDSSRGALLSALDGVDEERFYQLRQMGHEEYSVLSVLENAAAHDREHAGQIRATMAAG